MDKQSLPITQVSRSVAAGSVTLGSGSENDNASMPATEVSAVRGISRKRKKRIGGQEDVHQAGSSPE
ncbi:MAG: hypothetical protein AB1847_22545 [bacterium]